MLMSKIRKDKPGERFENAHERHRIGFAPARVLLIFVGVLLVIGSAVTFWLPGPQIVLAIAGLALISAQWRAAARVLDRVEVFFRKMDEKYWEPRSKTTKRIVIFILWLIFLAAGLCVFMATWHIGIAPEWLTKHLPAEHIPYAPK